MAFLLATVLNFRLGSPMPDLTVTQMMALLGIAYVLGILVDRAAFALFHPLERRHRERVFGKDVTPSVSEREKYVLVTSLPLREQILYNRSRLRICRSWILNFL